MHLGRASLGARTGSPIIDEKKHSMMIGNDTQIEILPNSNLSKRLDEHMAITRDQHNILRDQLTQIEERTARLELIVRADAKLGNSAGAGSFHDNTSQPVPKSEKHGEQRESMGTLEPSAVIFSNQANLPESLHLKSSLK